MTNDSNATIPVIPYVSNGVGQPLILHRADNGYRCMNLGCPCNASLVQRAWEGDTGKMARIEREQHSPTSEDEALIRAVSKLQWRLD